MSLRELLRQVADTYDANAGTKREVAGQKVLRGVVQRSDLQLPSPLFAKGYGGQSTAAATPWIGLFDPGINRDPGKGVYLAYIFDAELRTVTLTLQQGITHLEERLGRGQARQEHLRRQAARLRRAVARQRRGEWVDEPVLRHMADRPRAYEAASVIARPYELTALPTEEDLQGDLRHAVDLLRRVDAEDRLWWSEDDKSSLEIGYEPDGHVVDEEDPLAGFHPKDSSDYIANIASRQQIKRRHHEALIQSFGQHIASCGYVPITKLMHPKDLVLRRHGKGANVGEEWLVEAKVVRDGNPTDAVRQAVGQLYEYSHFLYREKGHSEPHLIGLFTENVGVYSAYLEQRGIASIWRDGLGWGGSPSAEGWGMTA